MRGYFFYKLLFSNNCHRSQIFVQMKSLCNGVVVECDPDVNEQAGHEGGGGGAGGPGADLLKEEAADGGGYDAGGAFDGG